MTDKQINAPVAQIFWTTDTPEWTLIMLDEPTAQPEERIELFIAPPATYPINHGPSIIQFYDETFVWYDEAGLQGGVCYSLEQAQSDLKRYADSLNEPAPNADSVSYLNDKAPHVTITALNGDVHVIPVSALRGIKNGTYPAANLGGDVLRALVADWVDKIVEG